ncbi:MAG TPA: hypothetical protein VNH53_10000 [Sphingomicrobium sp.]|jgi:hypothetical protein|nr:hypothetical protein [Sphingomicrobium sp.]
MEREDERESRPPRPDPLPRAWARIDDYLLSLRRSRRRPAQRRPRTQPEEPRLMLSTLPFVALLAGLALLALAIALVAMPRSGHPPTEREPPQRELGTAPPGWLERSKE